MVDKPCRSLANASDCAVASVEYRLGPESKFSAAAEDCYAATVWLAEHAAELGADPEKLVVAGDSTGKPRRRYAHGAQQGRPRLAFQILIYPAVAA